MTSTEMTNILSSITRKDLELMAKDLGIKGIAKKNMIVLKEECLAFATTILSDVQLDAGNSMTVVDLETGEHDLIDNVEETHTKESPMTVFKKPKEKKFMDGVLKHPDVGLVHRIDLIQRRMDRKASKPALANLKTLVNWPIYNDKGLICDIGSRWDYRLYDTSTPYFEVCTEGLAFPVTIEAENGTRLNGDELKAAYHWAAYRAYNGRTPEVETSKPRLLLVGDFKGIVKLFAVKKDVCDDIIGENIFKIDNLFKAAKALLLTPADFENGGCTKVILNCLVIDSLENTSKGYAIFDGTIFAKLQMRYKRAADVRDEEDGKGVARWESIIGSAQFRTWGDDKSGNTLPAIKGRTNNDFELFKYVWDTYVQPQYPHLKIEDIDLITTRDNIKSRKDHAVAGTVLQIPVDACRFVRCKMNKWTSGLGLRQAKRLDHDIVAKIAEKYGAVENAGYVRRAGSGDPLATKRIFIDSESSSWDDLIGQMLRVMWLVPGNRTPDYKSVYEVKRAFEHNFWLKSVLKVKLYNKDLKFNDALYVQDDPRLDIATESRFKSNGGKLEWCVTLPKGKEWDDVTKQLVSIIRYPIVTDYNAQGVVVVGRNNTKDTIYVPSYLLAIMFGDGDGDTVGLLVDDTIQFPANARKLETKKSVKVYAKTELEYVELMVSVAKKTIDAQTNTGLMDNAFTQVIDANMRHHGIHYDYRKYRLIHNTLGINVQAIIEGMKQMVSKSGEVIAKPREYCAQFADERMLRKGQEEHVEFNIMKKDVGGWPSSKGDENAPAKASLKPGTSAAAMRLSYLVNSVPDPALPKSPVRNVILALQGYKPVVHHEDSEFRRAQCAYVWANILGVKSPWVNVNGNMMRNEGVAYVCTFEDLANATVVNQHGLYANNGAYRWNAKYIMDIGKFMVDSYNKITSYYINNKYKGFDMADDRRRAFIKLSRAYQSYIQTDWIVGNATNFAHSRRSLETLILKSLSNNEDINYVNELLGGGFDVRIIDNDKELDTWEDNPFATDTFFIHKFYQVNDGREVMHIITYAKTKHQLNGYTKVDDKLVPNEYVKFQRHIMAFVGVLGFGMSRYGVGQGGSSFWCFDKLHCLDWMIRHTSEAWNIDLTEYEDISKRLSKIRSTTYAIEERVRVETWDPSTEDEII